MMNYDHKPKEIHEIDGKILVIYVWDKLSNFSIPRVWENVDCFSVTGNKLWTVNGMDKYKHWNPDIDCFVGARTKGNRFQLTTFTGNSYDVNLDTGNVTHSEFHK